MFILYLNLENALENALENTLDDPKKGIEDNNKRSVSRVIDVTELILMGLEDEEV